MWPYPDEYYRLQPKETYESQHQKADGLVERWEYDGHGYAVMHRPSERHEWLVSVTDLTDYYSICHPFYTQDQMERHIKEHNWRPYEQITLGI